MVPRTRIPAVPLPTPRPARGHVSTATVEQVGRWAVLVTVRGEVDLVTTPAVHEALRVGLATPDALLVVVDLSEVDFLAAAGLGALVLARDTAACRAIDLRLVAHGRSVLRLLDITGLRRTFRLHRDLAGPLGPYLQRSASSR
ncbi:anti-sigma factor antagonist [Actinokineospora terrae]|uniref:Anti-sigma factor antagonist n=1 Tax=Actinokineospora terrae TaxID=155974 RepID=A0A1H9K7U9_9PSEU|nr:anti-sigma factor antagonist [Actinokineospora terrae]SEQ94993.1 STAS domain-containing protein [Actinokineospora terrae]